MIRVCGQARCRQASVLYAFDMMSRKRVLTSAGSAVEVSGSAPADRFPRDRYLTRQSWKELTVVPVVFSEGALGCIRSRKFKFLRYVNFSAKRVLPPFCTKIVLHTAAFFVVRDPLVPNPVHSILIVLRV